MEKPGVNDPTLDYSTEAGSERTLMAEWMKKECAALRNQDSLGTEVIVCSVVFVDLTLVCRVT